MGNIGSALATFEDKAAEGVERAAVGDDGRSIVLTVYAGREAIAAVELDPGYAAWLASRLLASVSHRLRYDVLNGSRP